MAKEIAFIARGEVFVTATESGLTKQITNTPEQERFVQFTHDGKGLAYAREENGKWTSVSKPDSTEGGAVFFCLYPFTGEQSYRERSRKLFTALFTGRKIPGLYRGAGER